MEIGLQSEIHTYSGGLGVLAGDTALSCADLQIPLVFVSLISRKGYLRQEIDTQGRQIEHDDPWEPSDWAVPLSAMVAITLEGKPVWVRPWLYRLVNPLGYCIPVILLDTNVSANAPEDRLITDRLYGGDDAYRLRQEAVLGIAGPRILQALGFELHTYHLNEGHAALLAVELLRRHRVTDVPDGLGTELYDKDPVRASCIFTTHTPIEVAHDKFSYELVSRVLGDFFEIEELKKLAGSDSCNMTQLALNLSGYVNGVAQRHAETTRHIYPGYKVKAITNGVHTKRWTHPAFAQLYDKALPHWTHEPEVLVRVDQLDDNPIWNAHMGAKRDLLGLIHERTGLTFDPSIPLMGFARRMTAYKRPELLFADVARLIDVCGKHPFQVVWAGKAHPRDVQGKGLIEELNAHIQSLKGKVQMAFLPNYDLAIAQRLVAGCDIWLNTPLPPLEASGTSGMKAAINGVLNFSVLDGWWLEGWIEDVTGWAIGTDNPAANGEHAKDFYDKLEAKILPLYYQDRVRWIGMMKQSISKLASYFSSQRMMRRYTTEAYLR